MIKIKNIIQNILLPLVAISPALVFGAENVEMSSKAKTTDYDESVFKSDPEGPDKYDYASQLEIYGGKKKVDTPRPLIEWGREIYGNGPFQEEGYAFGPTNPMVNQFTVYGDFRSAVAHNDFGNSDVSRFATRVTLDFDWKLTATERLHFAITPLNDGADVTRVDFGGSLPDDEEFVDDFTADSFFFEGDLGAMMAGFAGEYSNFDMPFAVGLMPLQFQNGIWMDDAITGIAASIISQNSRALDISNYDITFFAGFDKVNSPFIDELGNPVQRSVSVYGIAGFFDAMQGYWELDYAYTDGRDSDIEDQSYHNVAIGFTRRYGGWLSNSIRLFGNFGQDARNKTADGALLLLENSLITSKPSTFIPYLNLFVSEDTPQALARANGAGGVLKNVGITFESDNMTGFPTMNASAANMAGGAFGLQYLFNLDQQLVFEVAYSDTQDSEEFSALDITGRQIGAGIRYQRNLTKAWLVRLDAVYVDNESIDDTFGYRAELRRKF